MLNLLKSHEENSYVEAWEWVKSKSCHGGLVVTSHPEWFRNYFFVERIPPHASED